MISILNESLRIRFIVFMYVYVWLAKHVYINDYWIGLKMAGFIIKCKLATGIKTRRSRTLTNKQTFKFVPKIIPPSLCENAPFK